MRKLASYAENPFDNIRFGRNLTVEFFSDMTDRLDHAVANGAPFTELLAPTRLKFTNLQLSHSSTVTSRTQLKSRTSTVNQIIGLFKSMILDSESLVLTKFKKNTPEYLKFFPNGRSGYNNVNKGNIDTLLDQAILAFTLHQDALGALVLKEFQDLKNQYDAARSSQQKQKQNKGGSIGTWVDNLEIMKEQAFDNLLVIVRLYKAQPDKINAFFDTSIITADKHAANEEVKGV
jgi:hypothetical protein